MLPSAKEQAELDRLASASELDKSLARLGNAIADRQGQEKASGRGGVVQFPLAFPPDQPPVSNPLARSSVFAAIKGKDRRMMQKELISAQEGVKIHFTGQQWNQSDHDLFMQLVQLASHRGDLGRPMSVPANAILRALGRDTGKSQHEQLKADMHRLVSGTLSLDGKGLHYIGHLVDEAQQDERLPTHKRHWVFRLNPRLVPLFARTLYTLNDWEKRLALAQKDLAKWLQLVIESHAQQFPTRVEWYLERSGSKNTSLRDFRRRLKEALNDLSDVGVIGTWKIDDDDLVYISRSPSGSQAKHVRKKNKRKQAWEAYRDQTDPRRTSAWDAAERRPKDITADPITEI
jgi:TrfA protein